MIRTVFAVFLLIFLVSCRSDDLKEDLSDVPDWDYSNAVKDDEDEGNTPNDEDTASIADNSETADENQGTNDNEVSDDGGETPECGNGVVDYNERCDGTTPLICDDLNSSLNNDGIVTCAFNCQFYDMQQCEIESDAWGIINLHFKTNFIMDSAKSGDPTYFDKGSVPYAAFNGIYGDTKTYIPELGDIVSYSETADYQGSFGGIKRQLFIKQNPVVSGGIGYPRIELEFAPGGIKKGSEYRINTFSLIDDVIDNLLKVVRFRLIDNKGGNECIMGIGYTGSVFITDVEPENLDLFEGGSVEVVANNIDFYHPTEVPGLDSENPEVPADILKYPVCTK